MKITKSPDAISDLFIPPSVDLNDKKYFFSIIRRNSFEDNHNIKTIEFTNDSQLDTIENYAFSNSSLSKIIIPPSVTKIGEHVFNLCRNLKEVKFIGESSIQSFPKNSFYFTSITEIFIPQSIT